MPRMKKKNYEEAPDVPTEADQGLPAWLEQLLEQQREMIAENWPQIVACSATNPDSRITLSWLWKLDMLDSEGSTHTLKLKYAPRPFSDERVVGGKGKNSEEDDEETGDQG